MGPCIAAWRVKTRPCALGSDRGRGHRVGSPVKEVIVEGGRARRRHQPNAGLRLPRRRGHLNLKPRLLYLKPDDQGRCEPNGRERMTH